MLFFSLGFWGLFIFPSSPQYVCSICLPGIKIGSSEQKKAKISHRLNIFLECVVLLYVHRYISSATSPKDIVILVDTSGSMTGVRIEIAKHTVNTIMGTLGDDDFFNVLTVSYYSAPVKILPHSQRPWRHWPLLPCSWPWCPFKSSP